MEDIENKIDNEIEDITTENEVDNQEEKVFEISISMTSPALYDYLVYHAYSGASGILGTCFGALGIILFLRSGCENYLALILGILLIFYLPVTLKISSLKQMQLNPVFKEPLNYRLDSKGITVWQGETTQTLSWDKCVKAVSTRQSILVYTGKKNASVFPRKQLAARFPDFVGTLAHYMEPKKVKIRY